VVSSPRWSGDPAGFARNLLLVVGAIVVGLVAESVSVGFNKPRLWVPDLATGWTLVGAGLVAWSRRRDSAIGPLLVATGAAWFAAGFVEQVEAAVTTVLGAGSASWLAVTLLLAHRAPFAHAILTYPSGHPTGRLERVAVAASYVSIAVPIIWLVPELVVAAGIALGSVGYLSYRRAIGPGRRQRRRAAVVASGVGAAMITGLAVRLVDPTGQGPEASILVYELALIGAAVILATGLLMGRASTSAVVDFVVELGQTPGGPLRDALADALGDPSLQIGFWIAEESSYVDATGRRVTLPGPATTRGVTRVERAGSPVAVLIHDSAVLGDPTLVEAVADAARLGSRNALLSAEVRRQLVDLHASRRRLIESGDAERARLEQRLHEGARHRLEQLAINIGVDQTLVEPGTEARDHLERARDLLAKTLVDLRGLADGLIPADLRAGGLRDALDLLTERTPVPVELDVEAGALPEALEAAIYFICAEAISNAVKHADANRIIVTLTTAEGRASLKIVDDGRGGADARLGSGLLGLADRADALGGRFDVQSPAGHGTCITAELPVDGYDRG
jgi:signal transduction histidine kinase